jgi:hypothetical protein
MGYLEVSGYSQEGNSFKLWFFEPPAVFHGNPLAATQGFLGNFLDKFSTLLA